MKCSDCKKHDAVRRYGNVCEGCYVKAVPKKFQIKVNRKKCK